VSTLPSLVCSRSCLRFFSSLASFPGSVASSSPHKVRTVLLLFTPSVSEPKENREEKRAAELIYLFYLLGTMFNVDRALRSSKHPVHIQSRPEVVKHFREALV